MLRFPIVAALSLAAVVANTHSFEDAATPPSVAEWIAASKSKALKVHGFFTEERASKPPRVVIVGRAFEGTTELAAFERTVCTAAKDCDLIAIDAGLTEVEAVDRWLHTGDGDLKEIVANCGAFGWSRAEAEALLWSLRERESKPTLVGIGIGATKSACEEAIAYLRKVYAEGMPRAERALASLRSDGRNGLPRYFLLDENERAILRYGIEDLVTVVHDQEEQFIAKSSSVEYARCTRLLASLQHCEWAMRFEREGGESDPHGRILFENAVAALTSQGERARLLALVHVRDLARASDPDSFAARMSKSETVRPLCIATACGEAVFCAFDPNEHGDAPRAPRELAIAAVSATPLESALAGAGGAFLLDLRTPPRDGKVVEWLKGQRSLRSARATCGGAGETQWDHAIAQDFDALAWFPRVTAARQ